jgi:hypothetical protein
MVPLPNILCGEQAIIFTLLITMFRPLSAISHPMLCCSLSDPLHHFQSLFSGLFISLGCKALYLQLSVSQFSSWLQIQIHSVARRFSPSSADCGDHIHIQIACMKLERDKANIERERETLHTKGWGTPFYWILGHEANQWPFFGIFSSFSLANILYSFFSIIPPR